MSTETGEEPRTDCRDGHDVRMTTDFDGEPLRCIRCKAVPEAATPPLDVKRVKLGEEAIEILRAAMRGEPYGTRANDVLYRARLSDSKEVSDG